MLTLGLDCDRIDRFRCTHISQDRHRSEESGYKVQYALYYSTALCCLAVAVHEHAVRGSRTFMSYNYYII